MLLQSLTGTITQGIRNPPTTARNIPLTDSSPMLSIVLLLATPGGRLVEDTEGSGLGLEISIALVTVLAEMPAPGSEPSAI